MRTISAIAVMLLIVALFSGCGNDDDEVQYEEFHLTSYEEWKASQEADAGDESEEQEEGTEGEEP